MSPFRKPWERGDSRSGDRPRGGRPRSGSSFRKPWERGGDDREEGGFSRPERRPSAPRSGFRKPWERDGDDDRGEGGFSRPERRPSAPRSGFRKPWERGGDDRDEGGFRGGRDRKPFRAARDSEGFRGHFDRKPFHSGEAGDRPARKPRVSRPPVEGELLYGRQPVREILRAARRKVELVVLSDGVKDSEEVSEIKRRGAERGVRIEFRKREELEAWTGGANHPGVVAICADFPYADLDEIASALAAAEGDATVVVLDHVQDPQNLGSILRTCECAGVVGVVLPSDRAVAVTPAAVRASAGAAEHLKIARVSNLVVALERFKGAGAWITGLEALPGAKPHSKIDFKGKTCLVIGSESHGICSPVRKCCDFLARLPMLGSVNSLNAGVAAAIALYEILRQHGVADDPAAFADVPETPETPESPEAPEAPETQEAPES
ncbi:MAG: 23S rRNA (guanosine(2251)-2'-O)-methyltransferase RlmB [Kiritimatiellae bacterium]|nr:23S rRNA (guanosine(2251)-2'-O)-methyltransferase RlmB [Kiritimatiellia bacterium]